MDDFALTISPIPPNPSSADVKTAEDAPSSVSRLPPSATTTASSNPPLRASLEVSAGISSASGVLQGRWAMMAKTIADCTLGDLLIGMTFCSVDAEVFVVDYGR